MDVGQGKIAINTGKVKTLFKTGNKTIKVRKLTPYFSVPYSSTFRFLKKNSCHLLDRIEYKFETVFQNFFAKAVAPFVNLGRDHLVTDMFVFVTMSVRKLSG